ncbi:MAG: LacI family transcriptional regulator [Anaerolineae bacterium]|nr:LacI family transcriptional regulator [Anaerolineae bacterium]
MSTPTSQDVAKRAGVSIATVSRVLNNSPHVRPAVRRKVLRAIQALRYQPNRTAQRLRARQSKVLGLIISDIQNPFFTSVVRGIEDVAYHNGYSLVLCNSDEDPDKEKLYVDVMRAEAVAGVIIASASEAQPHIDDLLKARIPVVALDRRIKDRRVDSVLTTNVQGAYEAVEHLIQQGHRHIGFIGLPLTRTTGRERFEGYQRALRQHRIPVRRTYVRIADAKQQGGYTATLDLLTKQPRLTALFAANNLTTLGALAAIRERGLRIPDDISIVGFDDMPWATLLDPPLTAVAQPTYELGQQAAQLLLARLKEPTQRVVHLQLKTTLVVRGSTSAPRK